MVWSAAKLERVKLFLGGSWRFNKDRWQRKRDKSAQVAFSNSKKKKEENSQEAKVNIFKVNLQSFKTCLGVNILFKDPVFQGIF